MRADEKGSIPDPFFFELSLRATPPGPRVESMPKRKRAVAREKVPPVVLAVVRPVSTRLSRIEALLLEMRAALDAQIKRTARIQLQLDTLTLTAKRRN
jgi:hypothetical protein